MCRRPVFSSAPATSSSLRPSASCSAAWASICSLGPTDSLILADKDADPEIVAADLVGQAEHGYNSPVWLVTDDKPLAETVMALVPRLIADLPQVNRDNAEAAWRDFAEVILCDSREEMAQTSDDYAPEHLTVQAADLDWWLERLSCYGSLFPRRGNDGGIWRQGIGHKPRAADLGCCALHRRPVGSQVHEDRHLAARHEGDGSRPIAEATARISRLEGMEGHARTADIRLRKYFPLDNFDLSGADQDI
jgi:sulfopropanediol 3-dehydrogenase